MSQSPSERTRVKRYNWLAEYDQRRIYEILDAMPMCSVGYIKSGEPIVTPTMQWRVGDRIYWHGSSASRPVKQTDGEQVCISVSIVDGLVLARSAYNFNLNHRSVMIFGKAERILDPDEKAARLKDLINKLVPNHWDRLRPMTEKELKATGVMSLSLKEASAKIRTGQPEDEADDYAFPVWAGIVPIRLELSPPVSDPKNIEGVEMPSDVEKFKLG